MSVNSLRAGLQMAIDAAQATAPKGGYAAMAAQLKAIAEQITDATLSAEREVVPGARAEPPPTRAMPA